MEVLRSSQTCFVVLVDFVSLSEIAALWFILVSDGYKKKKNIQSFTCTEEVIKQTTYSYALSRQILLSALITSFISVPNVVAHMHCGPCFQLIMFKSSEVPSKK